MGHVIMPKHRCLLIQMLGSGLWQDGMHLPGEGFEQRARHVAS